jgi:hypothetical protein
MRIRRDFLGAMSAVCDMAAASSEGCRAKKGLLILLRLRKRAHTTLAAATPVEPTSGRMQHSELSPDDDDVGHILGSGMLNRIKNWPGRVSHLRKTKTDAQVEEFVLLESQIQLQSQSRPITIIIDRR